MQALVAREGEPRVDVTRKPRQQQCVLSGVVTDLGRKVADSHERRLNSYLFAFPHPSVIDLHHTHIAAQHTSSDKGGSVSLSLVAYLTNRHW